MGKSTVFLGFGESGIRKRWRKRKNPFSFAGGNLKENKRFRTGKTFYDFNVPDSEIRCKFAGYLGFLSRKYAQ